jgi:ferredoxin
VTLFPYTTLFRSSVVAPSFGIPFGEDTTCISCGQCVSACPVGALTEKMPERKSVPLLEKTVEGTCSQCSVGCGVEYRWHGSLFTRVTERYEAPNQGKLCKKGKFGHDFLNDPVPAAIDLGAARSAAQKLLAKAKNPLMRISPYLSGEAIDAFLDTAQKKGIPVQAAGLEAVDPRWAKLASKGGGCTDEGKTLILLVGDISSSNNVAFTEAYRRARAGKVDLWIAGFDDETARRVASRIFADLDAALLEAGAKGMSVEVWVNPEHAAKGVLESLLAIQGKIVVNLLWNSRNAGYLFPRQTAAAKKPDLLLDVGVEQGSNGTPRIAWGKKATKQDLFIPLPRELWTAGRSHPTAMPSVNGGKIDAAGLKAALIID